MAYALKYRIEFNTFNGEHLWKIDIQEDNWTGAVTQLTATGDPLHFEFDSPSDKFNETIRPSKAVFNVISIFDFQLTDFYSDQDFRLKTLIYFDDTLFWQGFVVTGEYEEPYDCPPYPVKITAIDGLNYLKSIDYISSSSVALGKETKVYYEGRQVESKILLDILAKIQINGFREYVNVYDQYMLSSHDDSPIEQAMIDVDLLRDFTCWDVLTEMLKKYNAIIRQKDGEIVIYRPTELNNDIVYGRIFTAWNVKTSTNYNPTQLIKRVGTTSIILQMPASQLMIKRQAKKVIINQDYGYKKSWLNNWEFKANTYLPSPVFKFKEWTYSSSGIQPINQLIPGEIDGLPLLSSDTIGIYTISQTFGDYAKIGGDVFMFEFDYLTFNLLADATVTLYILIRNQAGTKWLYDTGDSKTLAWKDTSDTIDFNIVAPTGNSGWTNYKRSFAGLEANGPYLIQIYNPFCADHNIVAAIKNIRFYDTSDEISIAFMKAPKPKGEIFFWGKRQMLPFIKYADNEEIVGKRYVLDNTYKGNPILSGIDIEEDWILGDVTDTAIDNVIEQFQGAISINTAPMVYSTLWSDGVVTPKPIIEFAAVEIGEQHSRPKQLIQMNIQEYSERHNPYSEDADSVTTDSTLITTDSTLITTDAT